MRFKTNDATDNGGVTNHQQQQQRSTTHSPILETMRRRMAAAELIESQAQTFDPKDLHLTSSSSSSRNDDSLFSSQSASATHRESVIRFDSNDAHRIAAVTGALQLRQTAASAATLRRTPSPSRNNAAVLQSSFIARRTEQQQQRQQQRQEEEAKVQKLDHQTETVAAAAPPTTTTTATPLQQASQTAAETAAQYRLIGQAKTHARNAAHRAKFEQRQQQQQATTVAAAAAAAAGQQQPQQPPSHRRRPPTKTSNHTSSNSNTSAGIADRYILYTMYFHAYHGVLDEEQRTGQLFRVKCEVELKHCYAKHFTTNDIKSPNSNSTSQQFDDASQQQPHRELSSTALHETVARVMTRRSPPYALLEALINDVALAVLQDFPQVALVILEIRKPQVQLSTRLDFSALSVKRTRRDVPLMLTRRAMDQQYITQHPLYKQLSLEQQQQQNPTRDDSVIDVDAHRAAVIASALPPRGDRILLRGCEFAFGRGTNNDSDSLSDASGAPPPSPPHLRVDCDFNFAHTHPTLECADNDLESTIDYRLLHETIKCALSEMPLSASLESLATRIAYSILTLKESRPLFSIIVGLRIVPANESRDAEPATLAASNELTTPALRITRMHSHVPKMHQQLQQEKEQEAAHSESEQQSAIATEASTAAQSQAAV